MSEIDANDLVLFARVAEAGSFSRAADRLQVPKSTVSRRIAALEESFGERLFHRSTRKLSITDFGLNLVDHARALAAELDGALAMTQHRQAEPSGRLRVSLLADFALFALPDMLARFAHDHPAIMLELDLSPRRVDLIGENVDLAVRIGDLPDDNQLAARKLVDLRIALYASPTYVQGAFDPIEPDDLIGLHGLLMPAGTGGALRWVLERARDDERERWEGTPLQYSISNSPALLMHMAEAGHGVVALPELYARGAVERGALQRVLAQWSLPRVPLWAVFPGRRLMPARTRAFLDTLVATIDRIERDKHLLDVSTGRLK
jgi:DNA-binding transcriptional LysR family regulator